VFSNFSGIATIYFLIASTVNLLKKVHSNWKASRKLG
jgi:hypothetical protein